MSEEIKADSSRTLSRLYMDLKEQQINMQKDIDYIKQDVGEIKSSVKEFHAVFTEFKKELKEDNEKFFCGVEKSLTEKANLWVEWFCKSVMGIAITGIAGLFFFIIQELIRK